MRSAGIETKNTKTYLGCSENFKLRFANHKMSFTNESHRADTELSKYIWDLKNKGIDYSIKWRIVRETSGYNNINNTCNLCTAEKLEICNFKNKTNLLNKRNELVSKCRHENKFLLVNFRRNNS